MDVLQVSDFYKPMWDTGGVARYTHHLATALTDRDVNVTVYTTDGDGSYDVSTGGSTDVDGVQTRYFENAVPSLLDRHTVTTPLSAPLTAWNELGAFDLVHFHGHRGTLAAAVYLAARRHGVPHVIHAHGSLPYDYGNGKAKRWFDRLAGDRMLSEAAGLWALTPTERTQYEERGCPSDCIQIVPNGVDPAREASVDAEEFRDRIGVDPETPVVLYVGRVHERKGLSMLLEALDSLPECVVCLIGPDDGHGATLEAEIEAHDRRDAIRYLGYVSEETKRQAYAGSDVFVVPSLYGEGLPTTVLEAASHELPVVATTAVNARFLEEWDAGEVVGPTESELASALERLVRDETRRTACGHNARRMVESEFTWESIAERVETLYRDVL
jgi:glycosyltransferase involved in cell wall biosynthesis